MPDMTPQQLFDLLLKELSASGSQPLVDADGTKLTLRQAVARVLWKETHLLSLKDRPRDPNAPDDQYGHGLSTHAIALQNQALLAQIADHFDGIDVAGTLQSVKESFQ